ncbi:Uu.00g039550.m01.CDS01 [Anthostomella pinea]|uniref:Uu.00g039550.m01.CDS01 n=1 Tax=Anthostomella pinea TaxID=933095 RepID=A0AAI8VAP4_9PEZI|nr:Uu.00g039550.m01.CDS01 [Anthostomella pinea]
MKATILNLAVAATLATGAAAQPHQHGHHAHHKKRLNSPGEKREVETTYVPATVTQYILGNDEVTPEEAKAGLDKGLYIVVGETTPTYTAPSAPAVTSASSKEDGVFIEEATSSSSSSSTSSTTLTTSTTPSPTPSPTTSVISTAEPEATSATSSDSGSNDSTSTGLDTEYEDGACDCDDFSCIAKYGALALDYLGYGGFSGIQYTPDYSPGASAISFIETAISKPDGKTGFYSYACPENYFKSQYPEAQGRTGESIGGLYCNSNGKLERTRRDHKTLCEEGIGGITIVNNMSKGTSVCRTDYPGTEAMVIPLDVTAGGTFSLANVDSEDYYSWTGKSTTFQYYLNKQGVTAEDGCRWTCADDPTGCGNWAPTVIGAGQSSDGNTYVGLFANSAISKATLDFNVLISGDVDGGVDCHYKVGSGYAVDNNGCTVSFGKGKSITITFEDA